MLSLSKKTEYALIAMCHLARAAGDEQVHSARDIAERYHVPLPLLMNVLKTLHRAALVSSIRGARGGYRLSRPPQDVSLARLVEVVEGPLALVECVGPPVESGCGCDLAGTCPVRSPIQRIHDRFQQFLADISLADVAFDETYVELQTRGPLTKAIAE